MKQAVILSLLAAAGIAWYLQFGKGNEAAESGQPMAAVTVPEILSEQAQIGRKNFAENCAACHGQNAAGMAGTAPPLVHIIYEPGHHGDESFQRAVAFGVPAHHWRFGDMPPVEGLKRSDVAAIIAYVRELQRANGIR